MACCFLCFPVSKLLVYVALAWPTYHHNDDVSASIPIQHTQGDPIPGYARSDNPYAFHVPMMKTCLADPCCCLVAVGCPVCTACYLRYEVCMHVCIPECIAQRESPPDNLDACMHACIQALDRKLEDYRCCQGYYPCLCIQPGKMGEESCPGKWIT